MAATVVGIRRDLADGLVRADMVFLIDLSLHGGQILDGGGSPVVPAWDAAQLPPWAKAGGQAPVPGAWLTGIAAGDAGYVLHTMTQRLGESLPTFTAAVEADYNTRVVAEVARRRAEAAETGDYDLKPFVLNF